MRPGQVAVLAPPLLSALAAEIDHAGDLCARLEELVARLAAAVDGEPRALALSEAQTLDVLTQHLASLSVFMRGLSGQLATRSVDADAVLEQVPLSDLAGRLRAVLNNVSQIPPAPDGASGDLDLF
ncbi:hypothetical protein [Phenylobacterium sp.]|jgi:hypothetical protein|uniref:hypothetical protein n=1 Tax=Phenylobacterium sp. TaxID=1871053 RepID=UPI000C957BFD|nr:hypothetical protein [Phenylobacterium sp.]MAK80482.1 hypothetical protein [Phenylobacterium sp.]|tara:strand:+ start:6944 stop:7321 length:378 start_codon:yes stop_codon:yes gene_type:complete